jgi:polysaccharide biosynthesis transport protein
VSARKEFSAVPATGDTSLLRAYARWIVVVVLATMASAVLAAWAVQRPEYRTEAKVLVGPRLPTGGAPISPDMETEIQVVASGVVLSAAAGQADASPSYLRKRLSVTVPADSTVLRLRYADRTPEQARRRATAIAGAYITYRLGQASLLSPATAPRSATGPNYPLAGLAGLAVGLLIAVGSAILRDRRDDHLRGPVDFANVTGLPVLTCVPVKLTDGPTTSSHRELVLPPDWGTAEPYRYLRTKLLKARTDPRPSDDETSTPVVITVTSASRDGGAARAAANTAAVLARAGRGVVLVVADPQTPPAALVGRADGPGLMDALHAQAPAERALLTTDVEGLAVLPHAAVAPSSRELVDARWLRRLVDQLGEDVRYVVVLAPPVLAAAESLIWADVADQVLIVAAVGQSTRRELALAVSELRGARGRVLGGVLFDGPLPDWPGQSVPNKVSGTSLPPRRFARDHRRHGQPRADTPAAVDASDYVRPGS